MEGQVKTAPDIGLNQRTSQGPWTGTPSGQLQTTSEQDLLQKKHIQKETAAGSYLCWGKIHFFLYHSFLYFQFNFFIYSLKREWLVNSLVACLFFLILFLSFLNPYVLFISSFLSYSFSFFILLLLFFLLSIIIIFSLFYIVFVVNTGFCYVLFWFILSAPV